MGSRHRPGTAPGPASDYPPITQAKVRTQAKSRVSIETRELRLLSREYDFPGINIPSIISTWSCTLASKSQKCRFPARDDNVCELVGMCTVNGTSNATNRDF